ncbi:hypothetical protein [Anaeromyxobacter diazotrophicus]|uniref:Uncharacterized protein n=1 Tax=Anaeromyxobacter diazotrophicus TaxID=2590199 RepID=A0A7I9VS09_9BACT|nr:hypothetical protein [Anaeromyxobacter diazotrophicus]GEJ58707.1 hypothetical protein AMYX_34480 [Anaeromyxobacter diazotrophicus]
MIRVIGRIDRAEQAQRALAEAGLEARAATGAPMSIAVSQADGTDAEVLASERPDWHGCHRLKWQEIRRPVVMCAAAKFSRRVEGCVGVLAGPDAWAPWPPTGDALRAALAQAREVAARRTPLDKRPAFVGMALGIAAHVSLLLAGAMVFFPRSVAPLLGAAHHVQPIFDTLLTLYPTFALAGIALLQRVSRRWTWLDLTLLSLCFANTAAAALPLLR